MKKLLFAAAALFTFGFANAQENVIKANPLSFFGGSDLVSFEHKLGDHSSALLGLGISGFKIGDAKYSSQGAEVQYRYYFDEALQGWYAGGQVGYNGGKVKFENSYVYNTSTGNYDSGTQETKFTAFKVGAKGGYQWIWDSGFALDLNLGFGYNSYKYTDNSGVFSGLKASGILPNLGFGLGYAF